MKKTKKIKSARSKKNGIVFYSNTFPQLGIETTINSDGNIQSILTTKKLELYYDSFGTLREKSTKPKKWKVIILDVIIILLCLLISFFSGNFGFVVAAIYFCISISFKFFDLIQSCYNLKSKKGTEYSTSAFHAAEHMALNAYEKLQRIPTLEEIRNFSCFHRYCGSRFIFSRILAFLMLCLSMAFFAVNYSLLYFISIGLIIVFIIVSDKCGLLKFLQIFVTNRPSDKELMVAIEGLKKFEFMEDYFQNEKDSPITQLLLKLSIDEA